ncbi:hypothetical protein Dimus_001244 [Dionaea muscipula]
MQSKKKREETKMVKGIVGLSEDETRALRGSKFAPLPSQPSSSARAQPRLAHPGGPVTTNKAAALAKFLLRKLQEPGGLHSMNPDLVEMAVKNAKETVTASETSNSGRIIRHVKSFDDCEDTFVRESSTVSQAKNLIMEVKKKRLKKKKNKKKKLEMREDD